MRNSSATVALAPLPGALRAAGVARAPAPMTNRSTSKFTASSRASEFDAFFLHLLARPRKNVRRKLLAPVLHEDDDLVERNRLGLDIFLAARRREKGGGVLELLLVHLLGERARRAVDDVLFRLVEFGLEGEQGLM